jgi:hypothetical protein
MSYVLHIWEKPDAASWPASVEEAQQLMDRLAATQPGENPRFVALARRLTERYPCICSPQAEAIPESDWAWTDGPLDGKTCKAKYSIGLSIGMLEEVRPFVLQQARELGLNVTDEQAGYIQLANGVGLSVATTASAPGADLNSLPKRRELEQLVFERLLPFMEKHGYKGRKSDRSFKHSFANGWHEFVMDTVDRWPLECKFRFSVASRFHAVTDLIAQIALPGYSPKDIKAMPTNIVGQKHWITEVGGYVQGSNKEYVVKSFSDIEPIMTHLFGKFEALLEILEKYKTIEGMDQLLNPQPVTDSIFFTSYKNGSAHVVAAYLARNPKLDQLCDEFLANTAHIKDDPYLVGPMRRCIEYIRTHPATT